MVLYQNRPTGTCLSYPSRGLQRECNNTSYILYVIINSRANLWPELSLSQLHSSSPNNSNFSIVVPKTPGEVQLISRITYRELELWQWIYCTELPVQVSSSFFLYPRQWDAKIEVVVIKDSCSTPVEWKATGTTRQRGRYTRCIV